MKRLKKSVPVPTSPKFQDITGERFGMLTVTRLVRTSPTYWEVVCDCGQVRIMFLGNLKRPAKSCGCLGNKAAAEARRASRTDDITYNSAHYRHRKDLGSAKNKQCIFCGEKACDLAYIGGAEDERIDEQTGFRYSLDPDRYEPMCRTHHKAFDKGLL